MNTSIVAGSHGSCRPRYGLGRFIGVKTLIKLFLYETHVRNEKPTIRFAAILALGKQSDAGVGYLLWSLGPPKHLGLTPRSRARGSIKAEKG